MPAAAGSVLVVTHIDVTGQGAPKVREMLRTLSDTSRKESGNVRFDALQGVRQTISPCSRDGATSAPAKRM